MVDDNWPIDEPFEYQSYFCDCTCVHLQDQHGWGSCLIEDCPCEGGWEE